MGVGTRFLAVVSLTVALVGCGGLELGSKGDLSARLEEIAPDLLIAKGDHYNPPCPDLTCPSLVRWFDTDLPIDVAQAEALESARAAGYDPQERTPYLHVASNDKYLVFLIFDQQMIADAGVAPAGTEAEMVISPIKDLED